MKDVVKVLVVVVLGVLLFLALMWFSSVMDMWAFMKLQTLFAEHILWEPITKLQSLTVSIFIRFFWVKTIVEKSKDDKATVATWLTVIFYPVIAVAVGHLLYNWFY